VCIYDLLKEQFEYEMNIAVPPLTMYRIISRRPKMCESVGTCVV
jgi:hypothetical protein